MENLNMKNSQVIEGEGFIGGHLANKLKDFFSFRMLLPFVLLLLFHLPILLLNSDAFITVNDNLDSEFLYRHLLKISDNIFNLNQNDTIKNVFNGLKISFIHSQLNIINILFLILPSFYAYVFNSIIVRLIGFFSMSILISRLYPSFEKIPRFLISLSFSFLPIYTIFGLNIMGLPILFLAFIMLCDKITFKPLLLISFFIFYTNPVIYPIIFLLLLMLVTYFLYKKKNVRGLLLGIIFLTICIVIANFSLIYNFLFENPHRALLVNEKTLTPTFKGGIYNFFMTNFFGSPHPSLFISVPVYISLILSFVKRRKFGFEHFLIFLILLFQLLNTLTPFILKFSLDYFPLAAKFGLGYKAIYLSPFIFYLVLIITSKRLNHKIGILIISSTILLNLARNKEFIYNINDNPKYKYFFYEDVFFKNQILKKFERNNIVSVNDIEGRVSYKNYYSVDLFDSIENYINKDKKLYSVISIGIPSSALIYNGFNTLGGYFNNHPIDYHKKFELIQPDFENTHDLKINYEVGIPDSINLNINALKDLNCNYIFSKFRFSDNLYSSLRLLNSFKNNSSPYTVFVYEIND